MRNLFKIAFVAFTAIVWVSCENEMDSLQKPSIVSNGEDLPNVVNQVDYRKAEASSNVLDLVYDETLSTINTTTLKDTVVVWIEGGPTHEVDKTTFNTVKGGIVENFPNHSVIGVRQMHNINPTVFGSGLNFTPENAEEVNTQTLDIIERVVDWLKSQNKIVFLFGHSNGAFMLQNYLASNRTDPSYAIISAGRLDVIPAFHENFPNFVAVNFSQGTTVLTQAVPDHEKRYFNVLRYLQLNHNKNYINLLQGNSMLPKMFYCISGYDEAVGGLTTPEVNFIISNNIAYRFSPTGDHAEASANISYALAHFR